MVCHGVVSFFSFDWRGVRGWPSRLAHRCCNAYARHGRHSAECARSSRDIAAEALEGERLFDAEVTDEELRPKVGERAHRDVRRGPWPDAGQCDELLRDLVAVRADVEHDLALGERLVQRDERALSRLRHREVCWIDLGEHRRRRKAMRECRLAARERVSP